MDLYIMDMFMTIGHMEKGICIIQIIENMKVNFAMESFMGQAFIMMKITK